MNSPLPYASRTSWFHQARFGLFIHWGLYSLLERGEWVMFCERIPSAEYDGLADRFTGSRFDADAIVRLAVDAGMKYAVLTTRHHEGFCLWDTLVTDFNSVRRAAGRDFVKEFSDACRRNGLKVGFYLSNKDWRRHGYFEPERYPESKRQMVGEMHRMVEELLTQYGRVDLMWFDGAWVDIGRKIVNEAEFWEAEKLLARVYELQPHILINNRLGTTADLDTPEQHVTASSPGRCWESCMTVGDSAGWGFCRHNPNRKTLPQLLQNLSLAAAGEGNLLLNVGPRGDGSIPEEDAVLLRQMGQWLQVHGDAIYGSQRCPIGHHHGVMTRRENMVYLHVHRWSAPEIVLPLLKSMPVAAQLLTTGQPLTVRRASNGRVVVGGLPVIPPHSCQPVVRLEFAGAIEPLPEDDHAAWLAGRLG